ncbi:hypothetical protein A2U01_0039298 [Trifolium medium]|uniref:Uncharacterized protein n=1 Tax=Trifolium medium TaxID=97028 RepID=A0A392Q3J9_9FABA|nr:hypothetical protein [Trifolium medium]
MYSESRWRDYQLWVRDSIDQAVVFYQFLRGLRHGEGKDEDAVPDQSPYSMAILKTGSRSPTQIVQQIHFSRRSKWGEGPRRKVSYEFIFREGQNGEKVPGTKFHAHSLFEKVKTRRRSPTQREQFQTRKFYGDNFLDVAS